MLIYVLSNEMPYAGTPGEAYNAWLKRAHGTLKQWDPTRLYIGNAGFGRGRTGDIYDMHRYTGWYGGDFTGYFRLREDLRGGAFTITNVGALGGTFTTPIINHPEVAILGLGRSRKMPIIRDDKIDQALVLPLSLSFDHRVTDGANAARFVREIISYLETPAKFLLD